MKLTFDQIIQALVEAEVSIKEFAYGDFDENITGFWKEVQTTGGEDEGSYWSSTKYFKDHDIYICVTGYYQSYHGTDFYGGLESSSVFQIYPISKIVTDYVSLSEFEKLSEKYNEFIQTIKDSK